MNGSYIDLFLLEQCINFHAKCYSVAETSEYFLSMYTTTMYQYK